MKARLTEHETNDLIRKLEGRKYGRILNSVELSQKANVSLDEVNRIENQLPVTNAMATERIARALGISIDLLAQIAGLEEMRNEDLNQLHQCLAQTGQEMPEECERIGLL